LKALWMTRQLSRARSARIDEHGAAGATGPEPGTTDSDQSCRCSITPVERE
jgi:hypothetical protein